MQPARRGCSASCIHRPIWFKKLGRRHKILKILRPYLLSNSNFQHYFNSVLMTIWQKHTKCMNKVQHWIKLYIYINFNCAARSHYIMLSRFQTSKNTFAYTHTTPPWSSGLQHQFYMKVAVMATKSLQQRAETTPTAWFYTHNSTWRFPYFVTAKQDALRTRAALHSITHIKYFLHVQCAIHLSGEKKIITKGKKFLSGFVGSCNSATLSF